MNKLVTVTNKEVISSLKKENVTLLYPLQFFCVGYETYFNIDEIDDYCLVNRILTDEDIEKLKETLSNSQIKGIFFDDLGVIDAIKDLNIKKVLILDHIAANYRSINYYLDYVDSVVVSSDLTKDEIENIVSLAKKEVVISVFSLKGLMYSRRNLIKNYHTYYKLPNENIINASIENKHFIAVDDELGTKFYAYPYYNALELLNLENVLFYWYNPIFLDKDKIIKLVIHNDITNIPNDKLFLDKKTIYKVGDINA